MSQEVFKTKMEFLEQMVLSELRRADTAIMNGADDKMLKKLRARVTRAFATLLDAYDS